MSCNYSFKEQPIPPEVPIAPSALSVSIEQSSSQTIGTCTFNNTSDPSNTAGFSYLISFSNPIDTSSFATSDITNAGTGGGTTLNWNLSNCGDNQNFKLTATSITGEGTIVPEISAAQVKDLSGNDNSASISTDNSVTFDTVSPSLTINSAITEAVGSCVFVGRSDPTNTAGFSYRVNFSEPIDSSSFDTSDIVNSGTGGSTTLNWNLTDCGDDQNFMLTVSSVVGEGTIIPEVAANQVQDPAGNDNSASTSTDNSMTFVSSAPLVVINQAITETVGTCSFVTPSDPTNSAGFSYKVNFSRAIDSSTFTTSDITNSGTGGSSLTWSLSNCGDDTNFKLVASSVTGNGTIVPTIAAGSVQDPANNDNVVSSSTDNVITFDTVSPSVTINQATTETVGTCSFTAASDPTSSAGFSYKVRFSEPIIAAGFTTGDISNSGTGGSTTLTWALANCGDDTNFKLTVSAVVGSGTIIPNIAASAVQDLAGNNNTVSTSTDNSVTYDNTAPLVTIDQAVSETVGTCSFSNTTDPTSSAGFSYKVTFSKAINTSTFSTGDITNSGTGGGTTLTWTLANCGDDTNFKLTASSVVGDGTIVPSLGVNVIQDTLGNGNLVSSSTDNIVNFDTTPPSVAINQATTETVGSCSFTAVNDPTNTAGFSYKVTFSKAINASTFATSDITNAGTGGGTTLTWALANCGDDKNFKLTASAVVGSGTIIPNIAASAVQDTAGNNNTISTSTDNTVTFDTIVPSVAINQAVSETVGTCSFSNTSDPTSSAGFSYKVTFSEAINASTFSTSDISNSGTGGGTTLTWTLANCGDDTNFKLIASSVVGSGTIIPNIAASAVQDLAGNNNTVSTSTDNSVTFDTIVPTVAINQATTETVGTCSFTAVTDPTNTAGFSYKVTFSKAINASTFATSDISNSGTGGGTTLTWTLANCGDDTNFKLTASSVAGSGTIIPSIAANSVQDPAGNNNTVSTATDNTVTFDTTAPTVAINQATTETVGTCSFTAVTDPTNAAGFSYKVTFSKAINASTFATSDISNSGSGGGTTLTWALANCGDDTNFKLTASAVVGSGTIIPGIAANSVQDVAGNNNSISTATDNTVTFDSVVPTVAINQATTETVGTCSFTAVTDPTNTAGFSYKVTFSEAINTSTFATSDITNSGTGGGTTLTWALANCGDNTNFKLTASAVVGSGTIIPGIAASAVQDVAGNNNSISTATDNTVTFDNTAPTVAINQATTETVGTCSFTTATDPTNAAGFSYKVTFSEAINASTFATSDISNSGTGGGTTLTWALANCGDDRNFKLTASAVVGSGTIIPGIAASAVQDNAGNNNSISTATDNTVTFDTTAPTVAINQATTETVGTCSFTAVTDPTNTAGFSYKVTFSEAINTSTFATGDITNSGTGGGTTLTWALANCGDNTNFKLTASAVVGSGTIIPIIAASAVQDPAGNNNTISTSTDNTVTFDTTVPNVAINQATTETVGTCSFTAVTDPTNTAGFSYKVTFSEAINTSTFATSDITNSGTGGGTTLTWALANCGDNTNFKLTASAVVGSGTIIPGIAASAVQDVAGNNNTVSTATDNTVTFDNTAPTVAINQATTETVGTCSFTAATDPTNAAGFSYKVTFSEAINATTFTTGDISNSGTGGGTTLTWALANCGDDTNFKLTASAVVGSGTIIPGIAASAVQDNAGNNNSISTATDNTVTFDSVVPTVTINQATTETVGTCSFAAVTDPTNTAGFSFKVTFSEAINTSTFATSDISNSGTGGGTTLTWALANCGDNTNFKLTASAVVGSGTIIPGIAASAVQDPAGNNNTVSTATDNTVTFDTTVPNVAINQATTETVGTCSFTAVTDPTNAAGFSYKVTFSKVINAATFTTGDISNSGTGGGTTLTWALANCGDNTNFKLTASTVVGSGTIIPGIAASAVQDLAGNNNTVSTATDNTVTFDSVAPSVTINQAVSETVGTCSFSNTSDPTNAAGFSYKVTFSEAINASTFATSDISNSGTGGGTTLTWALANCGDDRNFKLTASAVTGDGTIIPGIAASAVQDPAGNNNTVSTATDNTVTLLTSKVDVAINQATTETVGTCSFTAVSDPTNAAGFSYKVTFSRAIDASTFATTDITNSGTGGGTTLTWALANCGDDKNFKLTASAIVGSGTIIPALAANTVKDPITNDNNASTSTDSTVTFDSVVPTVAINQSVTETVGSCSFTATSDPTGSVPLSFKVTFSEAINTSTFATSDISNSGTGGATALTWTLTNCGDNRNFDLRATAITGFGTIIPGIAASAVQDPAGNNNTVSTATDNTVDFIQIGWSQESYIKAANVNATDNFGLSISLSGDTLAVGAYLEDSTDTTITNGTTASADNTKANSGAVYVYKRTGLNWAQEAFIKAANSDASDGFGYSVSISGDLLAVGSYSEDSNQTTITNGNTASAINSVSDSGAVYVYKRTGSTWDQEAYAKPVNNSSFDYFGRAVSLSGDSLAVAQPQDDSTETIITNGTTVTVNNVGSDQGAVFIYRRTGVNWAQEAYIKASNANASDQFGNALSLDSDTLVVGAYQEDSNQTTITNGVDSSADNSNVTSGAAYVYRRANGIWAQEAFIKAANNNSSDFFAYTVSLSGDTIAVGAYAEDSTDTTITNGATASADNSKSSSGAVYVYKRTGSSWAQEAFIKASNSEANDEFGVSVSINGNFLAVGSRYEDSNDTSITNGATASANNTSGNSGAVYVYKRTGVNWTQAAYIKASNNGSGDGFGNTVSMTGDTLAVGVYSEDSNQTTITNGTTASADNSLSDSGAVYVYRSSGQLMDPSSFVVSSRTVSSLNLSWSGAGAFATGYKLAYQSGMTPPANCSSGTVIDAGNVLTYNVTGLSIGFYSFRICSYNSYGVSEGYTSTFHTASATPEATSLTATVNSSSAVTLNWVSGGGSTTGFKIAYQSGQAPPANCSSGTVIDVGNVLTYQATGLIAYTNYGFRLCSYDGSANLSYGRYVATLTDYTPEVTWAGIVGTSSSAIVSWTSGGGATTGFRLAWATGATAPATCLAGTNLDLGNVTTYTITGLAAGTQVAVRLCSYQVSGADLSPGFTVVGSATTSGWNQEAYIKAANAEASDNYGYSVSISGDTMVVGAHQEDSNQTTITSGTGASSDNSKGNSGAVYVYKRTGSNWTQEAYIKAVNADNSDQFGRTVSIHKDTLVVGAYYEDSSQTTITNGNTASANNGSSDSGAVYVYKRTGSTWDQEAYIKAANTSSSDTFGGVVSISGDTLAVGAIGENSIDTVITNGTTTSANNAGNYNGAVYIYKRTGVTWAQEAYIKAANNNANDYFGTTLAVDGDTVVVGTNYEDSNDTVITNGASASADNSNSTSGAAYVYKRSNTIWIQEAFIKAANNNASDNFGISVALSGDTLAVGANLEDSNDTTITNGTTASANNTSSDSGAVYVYKRTGSNWAQEAFVKASNNNGSDYFGSAVALSGNTLVVGAYFEDSNDTTITNGTTSSANNTSGNSGAVYVYKRTGVNWAQEAFLKASNNTTLDYFGYSVSISGDTIVVGAYLEDSTQNVITNGTSGSSNNSAADSGAAYVYRNNARLFSPPDLSYTAIGANNINLTWSSSGALASGYKIAFAAGDTPPVDCNSGTVVDVGNVLSYNVTGLGIGTKYSFRICSYDSLANLEQGYTVTYMTSPGSPEPASLAATVNSSSAVTLNWTSGGGTTAGFKIAYQAGQTPPANCSSGTVIDVGNVLTYQVTGLIAYTNYGFRLCSYDGSANLSYGRYVVALTDYTPEVTWAGIAGTSSSAIVTWTSGGGATTGFRLAWASGATAPATCLTGTNLDLGNVTTYTITGLAAGAQVAVRLCSYQVNGADLSPGFTVVGSATTSGWNQEAFIKAANVEASDFYGYSVFVNGETLVVGAYQEDSNQTTITNGTGASSDNSKGNSGAVYVYKRTGSNWAQEAYIKAVNADNSDQFGRAVSIHGDTIAVGSYLEDSSQTTITNGNTASANNAVSDSGAVYVYKRTGSTWDQEAYIKSPNLNSFDSLGNTIAINGDTIVVSATQEDSNDTVIINGATTSTNNTNSASGAVYIYKRTGVNWVQEAFVKAANNNANDNFGYAVSVDGDTAVVATPYEDSNETVITNGTTASADNTNGDSGAVYIYKRTGVTWAQEAYIKAVNNNLADFFGFSVSLSGDTLAVGATQEDSSDITITNGATASANNSNLSSGAVYIYKRTGVNWAQEAYIKASNNNASDNFGLSVALGGDTLAVGANLEDSNDTLITNGTTSSANNSNSNSGAVYVYKRTGVNWAQEAFIKSSNNNIGDSFGTVVSISGDTIVVGTYQEDSNQNVITNGTSSSSNNSASDSGAVYVYRNNARLFDVTDVWTQYDSSSVTLRWNKTGGIAVGYVISYQSGATAPASCSVGTFVDAGDTNQDVITGLSPATTYSFRVCAAQDASTFSAGKTVTVTTAP